jgi:hypothetical protein
MIKLASQPITPPTMSQMMMPMIFPPLLEFGTALLRDGETATSGPLAGGER